MTEPIRTTRTAARRFLAAHHMLAPARSMPAGPDGVMEVVRRLGSVQFDPLAVAGRNHDLVLHARVAEYDPSWTEELLYARRKLFETQNKGLSLLPTDELPWYRVYWTQDLQAARTVAEHADVAKRMVERIRQDGPLTTLDFESGRQLNWFGTPMSVASAVLNALTDTGVLSLARRDGNRRYYDLTDRLFPAELLQKNVPRREQLKHKMLSRFRAHGLLGVISPAMVGLGRAKTDPDRPEEPSRTELREELVESGAIVPVEIEGIRPSRFVPGNEVSLLQSPPDPEPSVSFLPGLDPLIWDTAFLQKLYDYTYVWEVYIPPARRRWGYYVLPLHFRDRFVAKFEPRIDRKAGTVKILGLTWEDGFNPRREEGFVEAMREALGAYVRFAKARRVEWPEDLAVEKRLFGAGV